MDTHTTKETSSNYLDICATMNTACNGGRGEAKTKFTGVEILNEMCELFGISSMRLISKHRLKNKFAFMIDETRRLGS